MKLFIGYDPGGRNKHGLAAAYIAEGNRFRIEETKVAQDAQEALDWICKYKKKSRPAGLGIDTLLAWSLSGMRDCDNKLRRKYRARHGRSVVQQNSLFSSMTLNGAMVASKSKLPLYECHPKLLRRAELLPRKLILEANLLGNDHKADALIAAWCASRGYYKKWKVNLFSDDTGLMSLVGKSTYPWPERIDK